MPSVVIGGSNNAVFRTIDLKPEDWQTVRDGMRQGVASGIVTALSTPVVAVAAKTGTAELGTAKKLVNSWSTGFWPFEHPHYAFAIIMEQGDRNNTVGATYVMQDVLNWMIQNTPEYLK